MRCQAIIFDLDGTLADSLADIAGAMNEALAAKGLPTHPLDAFRHFVGEGIENMVVRASPAGTDIASLITDYRARYAAREDAQTTPYAGIPALLDALAARHVPLAVLSNKRDDFTERLVARVFGRWPFRLVRGERLGVPRKPDPTAAIDLARALDARPERTVFVGDTAIDMRTAAHAGMTSVGCSWGFRGRAELERAGAHHVIDAPLELLELGL